MAKAAASFGQAEVDRQRSEWERICEAEAWRKQRAAFEAVRRDAEVAANATPETVYKARQNVAYRMHDRGQMPGESYRACAEVGRVFNAITSHMTARVARYNDLPGGGGAGEDWPVSLRTAWKDRYLPWAHEQSSIGVSAGITRVELVLMLAVDNTGCCQIGTRLGMDYRLVKTMICESLYRYAELAGWIEKKFPTLSVPCALPEIVA